MMRGFTELLELREELSEEAKENPRKDSPKPKRDSERIDPKKMTGEQYLDYLDRAGGGYL